MQGGSGTSDGHAVGVWMKMRAQLSFPVATGDIELQLEERCPSAGEGKDGYFRHREQNILRGRSMRKHGDSVIVTVTAADMLRAYTCQARFRGPHTLGSIGSHHDPFW